MYIKRVELSHFKSFGGTTQVPLLPGFTVISGPNGSGKSNILDALLFCLGLAGSKGMRADRLPDLVNQNQMSRGRSTVEASVTATFQLELEDIQRFQAEDEPFLGLALSGANGHPDQQSAHVDHVSLSHNGQNSYEQNGHGQNGAGHGEAIALAAAEWKVTRRLRVTQQGTYSSSFFINGEPVTLTELHDQLNRLRVYPEGYNIVLQGDVTSIISMNPRERREIIDELAGVAQFDRKIHQARGKLDAVKEREDRCRIIERELMEQRDRLAQDRIKAEKYQKLRAQLQERLVGKLSCSGVQLRRVCKNCRQSWKRAIARLWSNPSSCKN